MVKNQPANAGDKGSIPGSGRSLEGGNGNLLQCSCLRNNMERVLEDYSPWGGESQTRLSNCGCNPAQPQLLKGPSPAAMHHARYWQLPLPPAPWCNVCTLLSLTFSSPKHGP